MYQLVAGCYFIIGTCKFALSQILTYDQFHLINHSMIKSIKLLKQDNKR